MNRLTLLLIALLLNFQSFASHFSGGEIRYEFNGTNYDIYLTVYKVCEPNSATLPNSAAILVSSASLNNSFTQPINFIGFDTVDINCPNTINKCYNPTGTMPGYIQARFKGTITLPGQANDWKISWSNCCRISGLINCGANMGFYIDTWLDNTSAINSNPSMVTAPTYYVSVNDTAKIPLGTIDPEGDSIAYSFIIPKESATAAVPYTFGYSLSQPLGTGGLCSLDAATHTLYLKPVTQGMFDIAFTVDEYRNGVRVGSYIRDITLAAFSTGTLSFPQQNTTNASRVYTCPGQNNTVVLNYFDPISTDSVYLDVKFPNLTGWNFSANTTNGIPTASTTITWTTPSTFNPATLPHFYIKVKAKDNACPGSTAEYSLLVNTRQCLADSVWPGDANGDFTVNIYDPLHIAIANGDTGPSRTNQGVNWGAKACPNWTNVFVTNNTNMKHADCNGDGTVNNQDLTAVNINYSKFHLKGGRNKPTGVNDLYFDMTGIKLELGKTVSIPIKLGNSTQTISDVYGLGTRINISGIQLDTAPTVKNTNSWIDNSTNAMNFVQEITTTTIDWAHARVDQQNVSGSGVIGMLEFTVPNDPTAVGKQVTFSFENPVLINSIGQRKFDFNTTEGDEIVIFPSSITSVESRVLSLSVIPNPSKNQAVLKVSATENTSITTSIVNVTGQVVWTSTNTIAKGIQQISLPASELPSGMYTIQVETNNSERSVMKWIKH